MDHMYYLRIAIKLLAGFIIIVAYIKISGKGTLAPISTLDQVGNIVLGSIVGGTLYSPEIGVFTMIIVSSAWGGMLLGLRFFAARQKSVKDVIDGRSIRLMQHGTLLSENFSEAKISPRDFIMLMHQRGYQTLSDLADVWMEYNGQMTVVKKGEKPMAFTMIENGEFRHHNMSRLGLTEDWLQAELLRQNCSLEEVFLAEWHDDRLWVYRKGVEEDSGQPKEIRI